MVFGEGNAGLASEGIFGGIPRSSAESPAVTVAGASAQISKAVYVCYKDHVFFKNAQVPAAEAVMREVLGWVRKETDEALLIECDRPIFEGCTGFNGVVVLKNCVVTIMELTLHSFCSEVLNSTIAKKKSEYALLAKEAKNSAPKIKKGAEKT